MEPHVPEREKWANKVEFLLSCIGMSVGLGNVWRFPYVVYENGGGAFMVPYILLLMFVGRPMYYLELILGQFAGNAQAGAFGGFPLAKGTSPETKRDDCYLGNEVLPLTFLLITLDGQFLARFLVDAGIGWAMVYACTFISLYYNVILGYALLYFFYSLRKTLPWTVCDEAWADDNCYVQRPGIVFCSSLHKHTQSPYHGGLSNISAASHLGQASLANNCTNASQSSPEQFFYKAVLGLSGGLQELGSFQPLLVWSLILSWSCVYMCVFKGIKTSGKIVYVTALGPFLILGIMFIRGITLKGAGAGLHYYFVPEWNKVLEIKVWKSAAEQVFYSLSIAEGMIICFGGFNEFRNELHRDVVIIAFADFIVSMLSGVVVFSVLGNMAHVLNLPVEGVVQSGIGLAFITYPQALSMIPYPHFWSAAFFAMLFFLAIDTEFSSVECVVTPFKDEFPILRKHPSLVYFLVCLGMCIFGMPMATQGGLYILTLMDTFIGGEMLPWIGLAEILAVVFGYGIKRFCADVEFMMGDPPHFITRFCWRVTCPVCLAFIVLAAFVSYKPLTLGDYVFPEWAEYLGIFSAVMAIKIIIIFAVHHFYKCGFDFRKALLPTQNWGPKDPEEHKMYLEFLERQGFSHLPEQIESRQPTPKNPSLRPSPEAKLD